MVGIVRDEVIQDPISLIFSQVGFSHHFVLSQIFGRVAKDHHTGLQDITPAGGLEGHVGILFDEEKGCPAPMKLFDRIEDVVHNNGRQSH